ncbi:MAG: threonylcarbamoyl-AMP synthase [Actinomycetia bacterium]|nr:threonylcarbamoyl-AMP synthase [Actinomycetes bacterium]
MTVLDCLDPSARGGQIATAATALRRGRTVVAPGESSYLLICDAFSVAGFAQVVHAKGKDDVAMSALVASPGTADGIATGISRQARDLMQAFWPGQLTLRMRQQPSLAWPLTARRIAVRMPLHPVLLALAAEVGPLAVSTANRAGLPPALTVAEAESQFDEDVWLYLDAGPSPQWGRSTVVDVTGSDPRLLREGDVTQEQILGVCASLLTPDVI